MTATGYDCARISPMKKQALPKPRTVTLRPPTYQPKKSEMEERHRIDATPQEVAQAVLRPTRLVFEGPKKACS